MARLNVLEYAADFIRGWPHGEAVEMNYPSATGQEHGNGDLTFVGGDGVFTTFPAAGGVADLLPGALAIIARGKKDTFNGGGTGTNNLYTQVVPNIGILTNYVVRTSVVSGVNPPEVGEPLGITVEAGVPLWCSAGAGAPALYYGVPLASLLEVETGLTDADGNAIPNAAVIVVK